MENLSKKPKWYLRKSTLIVSFLLVGPFMLPAVWVNPQFSIKKKVIISVGILVFTLLVFKLSGNAINYLFNYIQSTNLQLPQP